MDPRVRDLYKRILVVGRDYPAGLDHVRERAKAEFGKRAALTDDVQIKRAIAYGRYMVKEMIENPERMLFGGKTPTEVLLGL